MGFLDSECLAHKLIYSHRKLHLGTWWQDRQMYRTQSRYTHTHTHRGACMILQHPCGDLALWESCGQEGPETMARSLRANGRCSALQCGKENKL